MPKDALTRGRRVVFGVVAGAALMTAGGLLATALVKSPAQLAAEAAAPAQGALLATVERRVLAETVVLRGLVVADQSVSVAAPQPGGGVAVVTRLPVKAGDGVRAGRVLAEVSGRPVFALRGALPAYRDLRPGAVGADVAQLQRALRELGHSTAPDRSGVFGSGTKSALASLYRSLGYPPIAAVPDAGEALRAAREAVRSARWALEDAQSAALAPDPAGLRTPGAPPPHPRASNAGEAESSPPSPGQSPGLSARPALEDRSGGRSPGGGAAERAVTRARETLVDAQARLAAAEAADGPMLPAAEAVFLRSFPARVNTVAARVGTTATGSLLTLSAGELVAESWLEPDRRRLLRAGQPATISSEVLGQDVPARVHLVATEPTEASDTPATGTAAPPRLGYRMLVRPTRPLPAGFAGQDVRLTVESASTAGPALVVPVTAVSAGADGRTAVTAVTPTGTHHRVRVRTGTSGSGYVEVVPLRPGALAEGTRVVTGSAAAPAGTPR
ncbi:peptidoglycan-binding protein [Streptomyces bambusae]|uniref:peptidoglycan-binding protein n=1 Tax=Streptomyces bambusae TaxID=1550616 RepID=UPI001CFE3C14|nr:peptidoglycan-binding protein [Streptomyces bambusae]MCB5169050.1 peptidoglycan-binding protein [Streptomyces bambusae]